MFVKINVTFHTELITLITMKKLLLFIVLMMLPFATNAKVKINGIYYALDDENETAEVVFGGYSGDVVIPLTVTQNDVVYTVDKFCEERFLQQSPDDIFNDSEECYYD